MMAALVRALARALTGPGWVLVVPVPPFEPAKVVPVAGAGPMIVVHEADGATR